MIAKRYETQSNRGDDAALRKSSANGRRGRNAQLIAWGEAQRRRRVPDLLIMAAQQGALTVAWNEQLITLLTSGDLAQVDVPASPEEWERLYRRADRLLEFLGNGLDSAATEAVPASAGIGSELRELSLGLRRWRRKDPDERSRLWRDAWADQSPGITWGDVQNAAECGWQEHIASLESGDDGLDPADFPGATPEAQFFLRVFWPCWVLFGEGPHLLFQRAAAGEIEAIEKLVALDKRSLAIPAVQRWLTRWQDEGRHDLLQMVGQAMADTDALKLSRKDHKLRVLVSIGQMSQLLSNVPRFSIPRLQWSDLRGLFDAVARDLGKVRDDDLPAGDDALRRAGTRLRNSQKFTPTWDIFRLMSVP